MLVTHRTWIVYGTYNYDPMVMFFGSEEEASEFLWECRLHPHFEEVNLEINEIEGVKYKKLVWVSDEEEL
tara:strand:- start:15520 stop:15729 length:210 start_codon:yes stop_codon:yes gene_type:complete